MNIYRISMNIYEYQSNIPKNTPKGDFCSAEVLLLGSIPQLKKPPLGGWG